MIDAPILDGDLPEILHVERWSGYRFVDMRSPLNKLRVLRVQVNAADQHKLACLFSALPYTQAISTLVLDGGRYAANGTWKLVTLETRWLAYALFHSRTKTSSWKRLVLKDCDIVWNAVEVLKQMGDSVRASLPSATKLVTLTGVHHVEKKRKRGGGNSVTAPQIQTGSQLQLRLARVKSSAIVYTRPSESDSLSAVLYTVASEMELEVRDIKTEARQCVLMPGCGFGWIRHEEFI